MTKQKFDFFARSFFFTIAQWDGIDLTDSSIPLIGDDIKKIVRPGTKTIIEAPEKSFKTAFLQRLVLGMSCGITTYEKLPIPAPCHVLYIHGELTPQELCERHNSAIAKIPGFQRDDHYIEGRSIDAHFISAPGQAALRKTILDNRPKVDRPYIVVLDPWQSFIAGFDENSFEFMSKATKFLDSVMVDANCSYFLPMHQGKDRTKGARGHSTIAGWKDSTIRLVRQGDIRLLVRVEPRWSEKFEFGVEFREGTIQEKNIFMPAVMRVRECLMKTGDWTTRDEVVRMLGGSEEGARKAIQRAIAEDAVVVHSRDQSRIAIPAFEDEF